MSKVKIITVPFQESLQGFDDEKLREFVDSKRVISLREFFFHRDGLPYLVFVITYEACFLESDPLLKTKKPLQRVDDSWKKDLSEADLVLFDILRGWRKCQAEKEGVPPYMCPYGSLA